MKMNAIERKLYKEKIIREYKLKHENKPVPAYQSFLLKLKKVAPFNMLVGVIAAGLLVWLKDWETLFGLLLSGLVWLTLISAVAAKLLNR